jgi:hypothetical protein
MSWLAQLFDEADMPQLFNMEAITKLLSEVQMKTWAVVRQDVLRRTQAQRHRASTDARIIQMTYHYSLKSLTPIESSEVRAHSGI